MDVVGERLLGQRVIAVCGKMWMSTSHHGDGNMWLRAAVSVIAAGKQRRRPETGKHG